MLSQRIRAIFNNLTMCWKKYLFQQSLMVGKCLTSTQYIMEEIIAETQIKTLRANVPPLGLSRVNAWGVGFMVSGQ